MFRSDDNLEKGKMGFLDHLDELRSRIIYCAVAIAIFFGVSWFFSDKIYDFLQKPVLQAIHRANVENALKQQHVTGPAAAVKEGDMLQYTFQFQEDLNG